MPAPDWIDCAAATLGAADMPLHAGTTVDLVRGNLLRCVEQGAFGVQMWQHDGDADILQSLVALDKYVRFSSLNYLPVPIRRNPDGSWRDYQVSLDGKISVAGTATVRAYLRRTWARYPYVDPDDGFLDETAYTTLSFTNAVGHDLESGTIAVAEVGEMFAPTNSIAGTSSWGIPLAWLVLIARCDVDMDLSLRALRLKEIVTV